MGKKNIKRKHRKIRCLVTGKILNNYEAISINNIDTYIEKQGVKNEYLEEIKKYI